MIKNMAKELLNGQMEEAMLEVGLMENNMVQVDTLELMGQLDKASGKMVKE